MARRLQTLIATLGLVPEDYERRNGDTVGDLPRAPTRDDVAWELAAPHYRRGDGYGGATWEGTGPDRWPARATLPSSGGAYTTDASFGSDPRTARTPTLTGAGIRAWYAIELAYLEPETPEGEPSGASVRFRLWDGSTALWWSGLEWEAPGADTDWNTAAEVLANFAALPGSVRSLAVIAKLGTTDPDYAPAFYGARVAYGVRQVSALDNALIRTVVASLRSELAITGVIEFRTPELTTGIDVPGDEWPYEVTGVDAVFDLTEDPDELEELAGAWASGTWTPATPIAAGHAVRIEFRYVPDVVARRHQDVEDLARLPAVYLAAAATPESVIRATDAMEVRDTTTDPPTALVLPAPDLVTVTLQVRMVAELGSDAERIAQAVRSWLGRGAYRALISPETGELITVRQAGPAIVTSDLLAQGVAEARASWLLTFHAPSADTSTTETLIREDGVNVGATDPTL